jgi:hypothetical protein
MVAYMGYMGVTPIGCLSGKQWKCENLVKELNWSEHAVRNRNKYISRPQWNIILTEDPSAYILIDLNIYRICLSKKAVSTGCSFYTCYTCEAHSAKSLCYEALSATLAPACYSFCLDWVGYGRVCSALLGDHQQLWHIIDGLIQQIRKTQVDGNTSLQDQDQGQERKICGGINMKVFHDIEVAREKRFREMEAETERLLKIMQKPKHV